MEWADLASSEGLLRGWFAGPALSKAATAYIKIDCHRAGHRREQAAQLALVQTDALHTQLGRSGAQGGSQISQHTEVWVLGGGCDESASLARASRSRYSGVQKHIRSTSTVVPS